MKAKEIFATVHNATVGHWGAAETWRRMNKFAPGHGLSQREVSEPVLQCANCIDHITYDYIMLFKFMCIYSYSIVLL